MKFNVKEESKTRLVFELKGETHTLCNILKKALQDVKGVETVSYKIDHPLIGIPTFLIETKGIEPRKALKEALKSVKTQAQDFAKEVKSL
ncbi:DNA-directed RNA polymerase subunit L [Candidatus Woesearchaeota archaeon CG10_big_fil_rev_8_21_14_0_10_32_24]|nr:MAG: DNA-directed RNA polymerase subunit L [Candidatus Woesearchaeota archaeon CG10_big_fil_rev_8_21_14_0_10_32_24]